MNLMCKYLEHAALLWLDSRHTSATANTSTSANDNIKLINGWNAYALQSPKIIKCPTSNRSSITTVLIKLSRASFQVPSKVCHEFWVYVAAFWPK